MRLRERESERERQRERQRDRERERERERERPGTDWEGLKQAARLSVALAQLEMGTRHQSGAQRMGRAALTASHKHTHTHTYTHIYTHCGDS